MFNVIEYPYQTDTYEIIGICMEVHRVLGRGMLEMEGKNNFEFLIKV